jgi:cell division protein FtsQ
VDHGEQPETSIKVKGWTPAQRPALALLLEQRDQLGSPLQTISIAADGSISLTTAGLGLVQLGVDPGLLEKQLTTIRQLSRSLPAQLKRQSGSSIDLSDPAEPELQLPAPPKPTEKKASER